MCNHHNQKEHTSVEMDLAIKNYKKGARIITEGEYGDEAYELISGSVEVSCLNAENKKVILAQVEAPHIFGEMALIEEKPRSATITALEPVVVKVTTKDNFRHAIANDPKATQPILRYLFERLRSQNDALMLLASNEELSVRDVMLPHMADKDTLIIEAANSRSQKAMGETDQLPVERLPYRIGRKTNENDIFSYNNLLLEDEEPFVISPNHLLISYLDEKFMVSDRGSKHGFVLNGKRVTRTNRKKLIPLGHGENRLVIGDTFSQYEFNLNVSYAVELG